VAQHSRRLGRTQCPAGLKSGGAEPRGALNALRVGLQRDAAGLEGTRDRSGRPHRADFGCGEKVAFEDRYLQTQVGTIVRINPRTATIDTGDGTSWRLGFALRRHVLDI